MKDQSSHITTEQIWRELSDRLRQFVSSRVNSAADVDDILQSVFLRIHQKIEDLHQIERLEAWVFQITRNAVIDHFRKKRDVPNDDLAQNAVAEMKSVENLNTEVAGCLTALIHHLPEDQQRAVSLYELEGISQKEIAERESIYLSGAKSRVQRGRKTLEIMLKECCQFQFDRQGNILKCKAEGNPSCDTGDC
ncbi:RNA polymerase sigma factor SigZ [Gimesia aquarii]|uniref:RNA polymerase sigma factor SigZ n=1 Tax=Gimesia aquarii TaxID=2527964 RepID=A0A517VWM8_9PLAN|nr:RNA polymerase sigma factor SigZ [Gimesia aquarii]QDT97411.1 ECF RNA polymerase sigma factor SigH [Gimesia aquarii]